MTIEEAAEALSREPSGVVALQEPGGRIVGALVSPQVLRHLERSTQSAQAVEQAIRKPTRKQRRNKAKGRRHAEREKVAYERLKRRRKHEADRARKKQPSKELAFSLPILTSRLSPP